MAAAVAFFSITNAHMMMKTPAPYGKASLNNSPLDASGSDFPCKQRPGVYDPPESKNTMPIGAPQTLSFIGSAVHGGGSCQISLTKDLKPTKDSKWMVIHSIEGGCPSSADGNLGGDPNGSGASTFQYKIPQGIAPGDYTLAWTWFNRIGNREMYMNCAPVTVTGGSKRRDLHEHCNTTETYASDEIFKRDASFPEMFKANIPATDCKTPDSTNVAFPNPGASVEKAGNGANMGQPTGPKCGAASSGSSTGSSGSSSGSSGAASAPGADGSTPSASSGSGSSGSGSGTGSAPVGAASPATTSVVAIPPAGAPSSGQAGAAVSVASAAQSVASAAASVASGAGSSAPAATGSAGSSGSSSGSSSSGSGSTGSSSGGAAAGTSSGSCSSPGQTVCSPDGTKIGTCDSNKSVVFVAVAPGTKCMGGQSKLNSEHLYTEKEMLTPRAVMMAAGAAGQKRSAKFAKTYRA
ncbi:MAG: hypothetical protein Q9225_002482 [Loekoesia sp. 1 TL-2023]